VAASDSYIPKLYAEALSAVGADRRKAFSREIGKSFALLSEALAAFVAVVLCIVTMESVQPIRLVDVRHTVAESVVVGLFAAVVATERRSKTREFWTLGTIPDTERAVRTTLLSLVALFCVRLLQGRLLPFSACLIGPPLMIVSLIFLKRVVAWILRRIPTGFGMERAVIYGQHESARLIASAMLRAPLCGLQPVALICDESVSSLECMFRPRGQFSSPIPACDDVSTAAAMKSLHCDVLILATPQLSAEQIAKVTQITGQTRAALAVPYANGQSGAALDWIDISGTPLVTNLQTVMPWHSGAVKRGVDIFIATTLLVLFAPALLVIAIAVALDSAGPVLFVQKRVGRNGNLFNILKFRSMYTTADPYEPSPMKSSDQRITRVGRILRRTGFDELPQLVNVLLGQMSLVGPRPEMPFLVERHMEQHRPRLQATPGITGLWQLSADRALPLHKNTHYDVFYAKHHTLYMDIAILIHTALSTLKGGI
jgi:exopolysaccharide biosynthesis polyprenyl glycosylphosphotransferase